MLQVSPEISSRAIATLWKAVGGVQYVPRLLRSGTVVPIHKSDDPGDPANYRPITLLSAIRRTISKAVCIGASRIYEHQSRQYGFQVGSNTDVAIMRTANLFKKGYKNAAALDLRKAYDTVPRGVLPRLA